MKLASGGCWEETMTMTVESVTAVVIALAALAVWLLVLLRALLCRECRPEAKSAFLVMAVTGLVASIGTTASGIGFAMRNGILAVPIDPTTLSLIASMGRGALFAAGLIILT
jgi:hypothetical protein